MYDKKIYVGNLKDGATNQDLEDLFSPYGEVVDVKVIESIGFGLVEMSCPSKAEEAKEALNNTQFQNRTLRVKSRAIYLGY